MSPWPKLPLTSLLTAGYPAVGITIVFLWNLKKVSAALVSISGDAIQITQNIEATTAICPQIARNWREFQAAHRGCKPNGPNKSE